MFNAKKFVKVVEQRPAVPSLPFSKLIEELGKQNFVFDAVITTHSNNLNQDRLILGVQNAEGDIDFKKPIVGIRLSNKLKLKATDDMGVFNELYHNYPVFFGESTIKATPEEIEDGAPETRVVTWLTAAPAGEGNTKKATAIDVAKLLGKTAGMPQ